MKISFRKILLLVIVLALSFALVSCDKVKELLGKAEDTTGEENTTNVWNVNTVYAEAQSLGYEGTLEEFIELISGKDGINGKDGIGISGSVINEDNHLILILTNGTTIDAGELPSTSQKKQGVFKVTFDYGDGRQEVVYSENYRVDAPETPSIDGYEFVGWCFVESSLNQASFWLFDAYAVTKDITLYAYWEEVENPGDNGNDNTGGDNGDDGDNTDTGDTGETNWWDDITYDDTTIIFQMTECSNNGELLSGSKRYLAGEDKSKTATIDTLIAFRNQNAYVNTKVAVNYAYYLDTRDHYFSNSYKVMISDIGSGGVNCPDIFCNWITDIHLLSLNGYLANIYTRDTAKYGVNYFDTSTSYDEAEVQLYNGYMKEIMGSLTLNPNKVYGIASDYFIDIIRSAYVVPVNIKLFNAVVNNVSPALSDMNMDGQVNIDDFYQEVKDGKWTYDRLIQYSDAIYFDANGDGTENIGDKLGFALAKNSLPAAGLIYSSSVNIIDKDLLNGDYAYPDSNNKLLQVIGAISNMMEQEGIMCVTANDAKILGLSGTQLNPLYAVKHKFANNTLLFGGIVCMGHLEQTIYQDMNKNIDGGFGVVPVPVYQDGDLYKPQIHVTGKIGAIRKNTQKFSQCSAFIQYQSENSKEILDHYYNDNFTHSTSTHLDGNIEMVEFIRENMCTIFDRTYEEAIVFNFDNGLRTSDMYHVLLANAEFNLSAEDFTMAYQSTHSIKVMNLANLVRAYEVLPA